MCAIRCTLTYFGGHCFVNSTSLLQSPQIFDTAIRSDSSMYLIHDNVLFLNFDEQDNTGYVIRMLTSDPFLLQPPTLPPKGTRKPTQFVASNHTTQHERMAGSTSHAQSAANRLPLHFKLEVGSRSQNSSEVGHAGVA